MSNTRPPNPAPTEQDRANYNYDCKTSPFYSCPEKFMKMGQRCRSKFRIWDLPNQNKSDWGWVSAEADTVGVVVHVQEGCWPTVRFTPGHVTCVTDFEVEPLDEFEPTLAS